MKPIAVQFDRPSKLQYFDAGSIELKVGDRVVVPAQDGQTLARVALAADQIRELPPEAKNLAAVVRKAVDADLSQFQRNRRRELDAFSICQKLIRQMRLPVKLAKASFTLGGGKVTYFYACEDRVDMRHVSERLMQELGMKVEMTQIGVRDATGLLGGIGICGREFCCSTFLTSFKPVSIKMAKVQNLSLNPEKVSGGCGRLRCCLQYELDVYHELGKDLPKVGKRVLTPKGPGKVKTVEVLKRLIVVYLGPEHGEQIFRPDEVKLDKTVPPARQKPGSAPPPQQSSDSESDDEEPTT